MKIRGWNLGESKGCKLKRLQEMGRKQEEEKQAGEEGLKTTMGS